MNTPKHAGRVLLLVKAMTTMFAIRARYWRAVGRLAPRVLQFRLTGENRDDWYVQVDESGATIECGVHPAPNTTWHSSARDFALAMSGGPDAVESPRILLTGDLVLLRELFSAIRPSN